MAAYYTFEDLSGLQSGGVTTDNPYHDLIEQCNDDPAQIQARYATHRINRNAQQTTKLLDTSFSGVTIDEILHKLEHPEKHPEYEDPRHCLVFWARPTMAVKRLIDVVQQRLKKAAPNLWVMPQDSLHMTALEVTHSLTAPEVDRLVQTILPDAENITDYTFDHRAVLVKPVVSFDAQALALSWLPSSHSDYTYHHLRRDLFRLVSSTGVKVASRYVIPSAHLTIGRFIAKEDFEDTAGHVDHAKVENLVGVIDGINQWLQEEYWIEKHEHEGTEGLEQGGEWIVGQERGLDFRSGQLWYGGGRTVRIGKGF